MANWQAVYRDHGPAVLAYLTSRMRREDAEDLLQETFVRAIRAAGRLDEPRRLRPYLLTIAHNLMVNSYRRKRPQPFSEIGSKEDSRIEDRAAEQPTPEQNADLSLLEERLRLVIEQMPPNFRRAFELAILQQESYQDVARRTGWSMSQVKTNVYRARQRAITELGEFLPAISPN